METRVYRLLDMYCKTVSVGRKNKAVGRKGEEGKGKVREDKGGRR